MLITLGLNANGYKCKYATITCGDNSRCYYILHLQEPMNFLMVTYIVYKQFFVDDNLFPEVCVSSLKGFFFSIA